MTPEPVSGLSVMAIAAVGLVINILVAWSLSRDRKNMNTRAALLHVMGDLLGSVAAIVAGAVIYFGGPTIARPDSLARRLLPASACNLGDPPRLDARSS